MKNKIQIFIYFCLIFFCTINIYAYELTNSKNYSSISGFVRDKETGETLIGASVLLKDLQIGARTNKNGYYSITKIPAGEHTLIVTYVGYEPFENNLKIKSGESQRINIELNSSSIQGEEIVVSAERESDKREITMSRVDVPVQQIKNIKIGGESDLFRALQYLPGILTSSQISSGLYVRGGSPDQNLILLDGSTVYNPSHLFGFFSTFNTDAIKDVELMQNMVGEYHPCYQLHRMMEIRRNFKGLHQLGQFHQECHCKDQF